VAKGFSMLDRMRQGAKGWVSKLLMLLLVVSFAIWGVSGQFSGYGSGTLATVGNQEVTVPEFSRTLDRLQRSGRQIPPEQVLNSLLLEAALDDEAADHNLGVSDEQIARQIAADPRFRGAEGNFDRSVFNAVLQNSGIDSNDYVRNLKQEAVRDQIASSISAGLQVPQPLVEALYRFQNEERTISTLLVDASAIEPVGEPDAVALQVFFDENRERFRAPEYRKLGLIVLDAASVADPAAVTPEEIGAEYEARSESFTRPERRRIEQIRFDTAEAAQQALQRLQEGTDFAVLAQERGLTPADLNLGLKTKAEILDPAIAEAAFAAEPNQPVLVTEGALEPSLIRVAEIEPGTVTPLEEVAPRLRDEIARRKAGERVQELYDQIEDERAGGATLDEVARILSLQFRTVDAVARDGTAPDGGPVADLPARDELLSQAFESDVGVENNPIRAGESTVFFEVLETIPARDRSLDEARPAVVAAWQADDTQRRIADKAEALSDRLKRGEPIDALAAEIGQPVARFEGVKRGARPAGLSANAAAQAFAGPEGHVANAEADQPPARVLVKVDQVIAPAFFAEAADAKAIQVQLSEAIRNDLLQSFNRQILQARETRVNNAAFAQITNTPQTQ
jgi:peptidyl-prolyl cis-trans isomerase D